MFNLKIKRNERHPVVKNVKFKMKILTTVALKVKLCTSYFTLSISELELFGCPVFLRFCQFSLIFVLLPQYKLYRLVGFLLF